MASRKVRLASFNLKLATSFGYSQANFIYSSTFMLPLPKSAIYMLCGCFEILYYVIINDMITSERFSDNPSIQMEEVRICKDLVANRGGCACVI